MEKSDFDVESMEMSTFSQHIQVSFSNLCNLQCRMCDSTSSSKWEGAVNRSPLFQTFLKQHHPGYTGQYILEDDFSLNSTQILEFIKQNISDIEFLDLFGGEPLLQKEHKNFLGLCENHEAHIKLGYVSNLTSLGPDFESVQKIWKKFKAIDFTVSIDGMPELSEYIRHGSDSEIIEANIRTLQDWSKKNDLKLYLNAGVCISAYNVEKTPDIIKYVVSLGLNFIPNCLFTPSYLNSQVLPHDKNRQITEKIMGFLENLRDEIEPSFDKHECWNKSEKREKELKKIHQRTFSVVNYLNGSDLSDQYQSFKNFDNAFNDSFGQK